MRQSLGFSLLAAFVATIAFAPSADACSVPVFRYALERWPADKYEILVYHEGELSADATKLTAQLRETIAAKTSPLNAYVRTVQLDGSPEPIEQKLWSEVAAGGELPLPHVVLRYPDKARTPVNVAWHAPLNAGTVTGLLDSPARRQIAEKLAAGSTAVWVFLKSGDDEKDKAARKVLDDEVQVLLKKLKLPEIDEADLKLAGLTQEQGASLKISFETVDVSRSDEAERALIGMLLGVEPDLVPAEGEEILPMVFPVFGRGRALYALLGAGINKDTIYEAGAFLTGPCSCQVKEQNPGVDLCLAIDWDAKVKVT
ncbi:MAG: hypothetical protein AAF488_15935, partial [Planctomycetota bacterium]